MEALEHEFHPPREDGGKYAPAFNKLPKTFPVPLTHRTGCKWPIQETEANPLKAPTARLFCNQPKVRDGDRMKPYCCEHMRIAFRSVSKQP